MGSTQMSKSGHIDRREPRCCDHGKHFTVQTTKGAWRIINEIHKYGYKEAHFYIFRLLTPAKPSSSPMFFFLITNFWHRREHLFHILLNFIYIKLKIYFWQIHVTKRQNSFQIVQLGWSVWNEVKQFAFLNHLAQVQFFPKSQKRILEN